VTAIVVDASVAADWLLDDEFDPTANRKNARPDPPYEVTS
jgi:hypothetical protein